MLPDQRLFPRLKDLILRTFLHTRTDRIGVGLLVLLPVIWWWPLIAGYLPDFMDTVMLQYPMRLEAARQIHEFTIPAWLPNNMSGMPLLANPETGFWYLPNILFYALPSSITYGLVILFHYILAGLGAYAFCRFQKLSSLACFVAALTFQFSAFMVGHIALLPWIYSIAWLPWLLLAVECDVRQVREKLLTASCLMIAVLFAIMILAGAPQQVYYVALILPAYWIVRGLSELGVKCVGPILVRGLVAASLAACLSAAQVLPTLDFISETERSGGLALEKLRASALNDSYLWKALIGGTGGPDLEDVDSLNAIGGGLILLLPLAFIRRKRRALALTLLGVSLFGYLLAIGALVPVWSKVLPGFTSFNAPRRALFLWSVCGPFLIGIAVHELILRMRKVQRKQMLLIGICVILFLPNAWILKRMEREFVSPDHYRPTEEVLNHLATGERFLTIDPTLNYSYGSREPEFGNSLNPNMAAWHDVNDINGYNPLVLARYGVARDLASGTSGVFYPSHGAFFTNPDSPVLRLMNVRYLIGRFDLFDPGRVIPGVGIDVESIAEQLTPLTDDNYWPLLEYQNPGPFAWLPMVTSVNDTPREALLQSMRFQDPRSVACVDLESDAAYYTPPQAATNPDLKILSAEWLNARTVEVTLSGPVQEDAGRILATAISWHSGWKAVTDDHGNLPTYPVNAFNTATTIPKGADRIQLVYAPRSVMAGSLISLTGLLLLLLGFLKTVRRKA